MRIQVARKFKPFLSPSRYKAAYGGRGGAKSHFFAEQIIVRCYARQTRVVCIREVQKSIKDSVRQLLIDKIAKLGLEAYFEILETEIRGPNGSVIIFVGMQAYNSENIKSLEGFDIAWVEEGQTFSQRSLDMLRPTIRKEGSELWFSWNPRYKTDAVDKFFRKRKPDNAIVVKVGWQDNPWFPAVLRKEMEDDFAADEDKAEHIWNGEYGAGQGAILAKWVNKARRLGRIHEAVSFDPDGAPIEIFSDIGFRDTACWWFWQRKPGGYSIFAYDFDHGLDADDWIDRLKAKLVELKIPPHKLGIIWLPPDAKAKTFQSKHSAMERFLKAFPDKVKVKPASKKSDQINAARTIIGQCEINSVACEDGLDGLEAWEFDYNEDQQVFSREPKHDWASHRGDSFSYGCEMMQEPAQFKDEPEPVKSVKPMSQMTYDEFFAAVPDNRESRI
ncbi:MAG TPA: PBSX family phage terminase large subunit [Ensifer sp.]|nr:PBSX family phage terminase large subunit [Ensifer sp.]